MKKFFDFIKHSSFDRVIITLLIASLLLYSGDLLEFDPLTWIGGFLFFACLIDVLLLLVLGNVGNE